MSINNWNWPDEDLENKESVENQKTKKEDLKREFLDEFKGDILNEKQEKRVAFYNKLDEKDNSKIYSKLEQFKKDKEFIWVDKFKNFDIKKEIKFSEIENLFSKDIAELNVKRIDLKNEILRIYDISEKDYEKEILPSVKDLTINNFYDFRRKKEKLKNFIEKIYSKSKKKAPNERINLDRDLMKDLELWFKDILEADKLPIDEKNELVECLQTLSKAWLNWWKFDWNAVASLARLFELNILDSHIFQKILDAFYPKISLKDADELGYVSEAEKFLIYEKELWNKKEEIYARTDLNKEEKKEEIIKEAKERRIAELFFYPIRKFINSKERVKHILENIDSLDYQIADRIWDEINYRIDKEKEILEWSPVEENIEEQIQNQLWKSEEDIKNIEDIKSTLKNFNLTKKSEIFTKLENFWEGSVIELISNSDSFDTNIYIQILSIDDRKRKLKVRNLWTWAINLNRGDTNDNELSYSEFTKTLIKNNLSAEFLKLEDVKKELKDPDGKYKNIDLTLYSKEDLKNEEYKALVLKQYYLWKKKELDNLMLEYDSLEWKDEGKREQIFLQIQAIQDELNLEKERESFKKDLEELKKQKEFIENNSIDIDEDEYKELINQIESLEEKLSDEDNKNLIADETLINYSNFSALLSKIDELDPDWSSIGIEKWKTYIKVEGWWHLVVWVDLENGTIRLKTREHWEYDVDYDQFYLAFKEFNAKRTEHIGDFWEFLSEMWNNSDLSKSWNKVEFKNNQLIIKEKPKNISEDTVDFLVSPKWEVIYIESIFWDELSIKRWEVFSKETKDNKREEDWKKTKEEVRLYREVETISLNDLKVLTEEESYIPSFETGKKIVDAKEKDLTKDIKRNFFGHLWNKWMTFQTFLQGWKMFIDWIEEYLDKWTDLDAAQFAWRLWWLLWVFSSELWDQMKMKVEWAQWEASEKALAELKKIDSWAASERIEKRLLNRNTPEYKKEAWLLFMLENYWVLNWKSWLAKYNGRFLWYQAFGWKIGDAFYKKQERYCEESWITFSEENLMYWFVKEQWWRNWYNWIKRRSRLYKEIDWKWSAWIKWDFEKWEKDAWNKRNIKDMVAWAVWDIGSGNIPSVFWWANKLIWVWWDLELMNEAFFCLFYSGALYDTDQKTFLKFKDFWLWQWMPMSIVCFWTTEPDMRLYNQTVLELSKRMGELEPDRYWWMWKEAEEIFNSAKDSKWRSSTDLKKRVENTQKFWKKYGKPLSRALNMVHTKNTEYSMTDKIIKLEKENNPVFNKFYNHIRWWSTEWAIFHKDYMDDALWSAWVSWMNTKKVVWMWLKQWNQWFVENKVAKKMWAQISEDIDAVKNAKFSNDWEEDYKLKQKYLIHELRDIISAMIDIYWLRSEMIFPSLMNRWTEIWASFYKWKLNIYDFWGWPDWNWKKFTASEISSWKVADVEELLKKISDNILKWRSNDDLSFEELMWNIWSREVENTKQKTKNNVGALWWDD